MATTTGDALVATVQAITTQKQMLVDQMKEVATATNDLKAPPKDGSLVDVSKVGKPDNLKGQKKQSFAEVGAIGVTHFALGLKVSLDIVKQSWIVLKA